ncbi:MAG: hypothetical protein J6W13_07105 [Salinivirgaceae bacterium]|nr:hypothetical protein [Salinivirgaceae bacterium]
MITAEKAIPKIDGNFKEEPLTLLIAMIPNHNDIETYNAMVNPNTM